MDSYLGAPNVAVSRTNGRMFSYQTTLKRAMDGEQIQAIRMRRCTVRWFALCLLSSSLLLNLGGCQTSSTWLRTRKSPRSPLAAALKLKSWKGPEPTERTMQWLRRYDLVKAFEENDEQEFINTADEVAGERQSEEDVYSLSELAFIAGDKAEHKGDYATAFDLYGISVANAYLYLVDQKFDLQRNPYDPRFRQACDLYNGSLEAVMRLAQRDGPLTPGTKRAIETSSQSIQLSIVSRGSWRADQISRVEFASDYQSKGLKNQVQRFGLGVPLILVYRPDLNRAEDQFYAPGMSVGATAFLRVVSDEENSRNGRARHNCVIELHDPLQTSDVQLEDTRLVPLETDLSTPLAYSLSDPLFQDYDVGTRGLLNPRASQSVQGLYMLEPYDPHKVPVLMVHGLWSSLITWMDMFNDLRGDTDIRDHYQFWFYLYPTGQPFWTTSAQLRQDLAHARQVLDPDRRSVALDQMVLVGHSMGGLVSKMQTLQSRDDYWNLISDKPLDDLQIPNDLRQQLKETWFFEPNPSISRVVTIASPHRGSEFSNSTTQWLARKLIRLPEALAENTQRLFAQDATLRRSPLLRINNSIASLSPDSPVFKTMLESPHLPKVNYHNIVGVVPQDNVLGKVISRGDGIVKFESAHLETATSEIVVPEDHIKIHLHPRAILEVQRVLLEHLGQLKSEYAAAENGEPQRREAKNSPFPTTR